ncbi:MAG: HAD-IA family hydrolase [Endomicrobia bacterium]|nr:HAD-IA family hydrolase [Endomicrobiia bacterium]MCL2506353.1 HAD-IA family hydrolase [Endomicrobiia bacterium]
MMRSWEKAKTKSLLNISSSQLPVVNMGYDFLIFDLDGTIADSQKDITSAINLVRNEYGCKPLTVKKVRSFLGSGVNALIDKAFPGPDKEIHKNALKRFKFHYGQTLTDTTVLYPGIEKTLKTLKSKKKAILSNKTEDFSQEIVKRLRISKYFIEVWGGDTAGVKKPDPKPVFDLMKIAGIKPDKTVLIGDSENDFRAAKAAGIASIAVLYGYSDIKQIKKFKPDYIIEKPEEIINIVR